MSSIEWINFGLTFLTISVISAILAAICGSIAVLLDKDMIVQEIKQIKDKLGTSYAYNDGGSELRSNDRILDFHD